MERAGEAYVNRHEEDEMEISGYSPCCWKLALVSLGTVCSGGSLLLFLYWLPELSVKWTCRAVPLHEARVLLLRTTVCLAGMSSGRGPGSGCVLSPPLDPDPLGFSHLSEGKRPPCQDGQPDDWDCKEGLLSQPACGEQTELRFFVHHNVRYLWHAGSQSFQQLRALDSGVPCSSLHNLHGSGIPCSTQDYRRLFFGANQIDQYVLLHDMVAAHNIIRVTVFRGPYETEEIFSTELVPGDVVLVPPEGLTVPCDAVLLSGTAITNESMLTGESIPVTKTALPDPARGTNGLRQDPAYDPEEHKRHTLFCGTSVIQTRYYSGEAVRALVIRTGFATSKGQLVCSILFPKPTDFRLYRDAYRFLLCLVGVAGIGMLYSVIRSVQQAEPVSRIILESLDILTITVPPALPAAMTAGVVYAQRRLRGKRIFSISPQRINICGQINLMCFDKTGTLTEDGLDFWGFVRAQEGSFLPAGQDLGTPDLTASPFVAAMATCHSLTTIGGRLSGDPLDLKMFEATGWVLEEPTREETALHNQIQPTVVRPADQVPPETPKGTPEEKEIMDLMSVYQIGLLVQFPFSSSLQRMSVVTRTLGEKRLTAYMKGAPETVASLCRKETVPETFLSVLESYTRRGLRVIALARRRLESKYSWHKVQHINRDAIECQMEFLGLVMLQNKLKPETVPVLAELRRACIRPVMVTGDNLLTAISVARECGMIPAKGKVVLTEALPPRDGQPATLNWQYADELPGLETTDKASKEARDQADGGRRGATPGPQPGVPEVSYHFAIGGKSFSVILDHFPDLLPKLLLCGTIYARMAPDQKTQLVESLQKMDYYVGMCGDGANDCGALKRAHAGISLSELEASVASPFTSKTPNISCIPDLIRIIQYLSVLLLYSILGNLGDVQYLFIDMAIILSLAFTMSLNRAWRDLAAQRPPTSLVSPQLLLSVLCQILLSMGFQVGAFLLVQAQPWYHHQREDGGCALATNLTGGASRTNVTAQQGPEEEDEEGADTVRSFENTTLFFVSCFQYIAVAVAFAKGRPFRQPTWTNGFFVASLVATSSFLFFLLLWPIPALDHFFQLACIPYEWRLILLVLVLSNLLLAVSLENFVCDCDALWQRVCYTRRQFEYPHQATYPQYKRLAQELLFDPDWPPQPRTSTKGQALPAESSA
ncbi:hypothetical protein JRQ81_004585 [Phrynocephalus forsythii]|uniref:Cation-transporting ATPase n=1 Tax=Phrynocephalus forsythii TaxID=171643 RepID=A0A9Q0XFF5_9SAUR|nr:hypothetical protein JRQ81_004585 [Phrynocephalus forsythii]